MIPTLTVATESDARIVMCALWDAAQAFRRAGDSDSATRCYELATEAGRETRRIQSEIAAAALFDSSFL